MFWLIQLITFLSAFLLFQMELLIGKVFLPNFGGSFMVWGACVVFFQAAFLLGYKYAQVVVERVGIARYRMWHCALGLLPLISFPGRALPLQFESGSLPMMLAVFWQLSVLIGLVFFVLTTTSVIWQVWLSSSDLPQRKNPYALFAVSNYGSFAALLSYPFYFELYHSLIVQQNIWRVAYVVFLALQWWAFKQIGVRKEKERKVALKKIPLKKAFMWGAYAAAGVMMFLSTTNIMTSEIAPVPLLWVVPLMIYLVSFVLNFKKKPYCPKWLKSEFHLLSGVGVVSYFVTQSPIFPMAINILILCTLTYYVCMFAQFKLFQLKPVNHQYLPFYYFVISLGSLIGGVLVTWIIPLIASSFMEYFCGFAVIAIALYLERRTKTKAMGYGIALIAVVLLFVWPAIFNQEAFRFSALQLVSLLALMITIAFLFSSLKSNAIAYGLSFLVLMGCAERLESSWNQANYIYQNRNYYGISRIIEDDQTRTFLHGKTTHGIQYKDPAKAHIPLSYYGADSGIGQLLKGDLLPVKNVGIIGLGIGTLGTYFKDDWQIDYFELEADVKRMADRYFSFTKHAKGKIRTYVGDGRFLLKGVADHKYDVLIADAFSGDSIPIHLMTQEAFALYRQKIKTNGLILFHISNRYIDIGQPLLKTARSLGAQLCFKDVESDAKYVHDSRWVAITWDDAQFARLTNDGGWQPTGIVEEGVRTWTDAYNSILPYIYYDEILYDLKTFLYFLFK